MYRAVHAGMAFLSLSSPALALPSPRQSLVMEASPTHAYSALCVTVDDTARPPGVDTFGVSDDVRDSFGFLFTGTASCRRASQTEVTCILPDRLYLGAATAARDELFLTGAGVRVIVNCCERDECEVHAPSAGVRDVCIPMQDTDDFDAVDALIDGSDAIHAAIQAHEPVLVHCRVGMSRSVSVVLAYLVRYMRQSLLDAWKHVKALRSISCPNLGLCRHLRSLEYETHHCNSVPEIALALHPKFRDVVSSPLSLPRRQQDARLDTNRARGSSTNIMHPRLASVLSEARLDAAGTAPTPHAGTTLTSWMYPGPLTTAASASTLKDMIASPAASVTSIDDAASA